MKNLSGHRAKKRNRVPSYFRLPHDCVLRLERESKRTKRDKTAILVDAIRQGVPLFIKAVKRAGE